MQDQKSNQPYRSFFWPLLLIGVGIAWLLANVGIIESFSLSFLLRLWPVVLIAFGLDLMFGRRSPIFGALIGLGVVAFVVLLLVMAPNLDVDLGPELKTLNLSEPLDDASSARIDLNLTHYPTTIEVLEDSNALIEAELETLEDVSFDVHGTNEKVVKLEPRGDTSVIDWVGTLGKDARWEIALSPQIPVDLKVDGGSGSVRLDLEGMILEGFDIDGASGSTRLILPSSTESYDVRLDGASGSFTVEIVDGAILDANIDVDSGSFKISFEGEAEAELDIGGGSGSTTITVPEGAGVRLVVRDSGSGSIHVPDGYTLVSDGRDDDEDTGTWESEDYDDSEFSIEITYEGKSGSFTLRED
jgi:hypothetical protein